jgi:hypothetical protein
MKKQTIFTIFAVVLLGLAFSLYQYSETFKTEVASATSTVPNPGHLWSSMECNSDTLCVDTTNKRLGIGTASPGAKIDIKGDTTTWGGMARIFLTDSNTNANSRNWSIGNGGSDYGNLSFYVSTAKDGLPESGTATHVMSLKNNGNVGIGTSAPTAKLDIVSPAYSGSENTATSIFTNNAGGYANGQNTAVYGYTLGSGTTIAGYFYGQDVWAAGSATYGVKAMVSGYAPNRYGVYISSTDSSYGTSWGLYSVATKNYFSGSVGIGTATPGYALTVAGTAWVTSGSWSGSDARWKKNVSTLSTASSLDKILALNPVNYEWKTDEYPEMKFSKDAQLGFIAQDVENIIPEVVTTDNNGYKGISYEKIVPVLTSAIQEQQKEIEQLKTMVCSDHPLAEICK